MNKMRNTRNEADFLIHCNSSESKGYIDDNNHINSFAIAFNAFFSHSFHEHCSLLIQYLKKPSLKE